MKGDIIISRNDVKSVKETSVKRDLLNCRFKWNLMEKDDVWYRIDKYYVSESKGLAPHVNSYYIPVDPSLYLIVSSDLSNYEVMVSDLYITEKGTVLYSIVSKEGAQQIGRVIRLDLVFMSEIEKPVINRFIIYSLNSSMTDKLSRGLNSLIKKDMVLVSAKMPSCSLYYVLYQEDEFYSNKGRDVFNEVGYNCIPSIWNPFICDFSLSISCYAGLTNVERSKVRAKKSYYSGDGCSLSLDFGYVCKDIDVPVKDMIKMAITGSCRAWFHNLFYFSIISYRE